MAFNEESEEDMLNFAEGGNETILKALTREENQMSDEIDKLAQTIRDDMIEEQASIEKDRKWYQNERQYLRELGNFKKVSKKEKKMARDDDRFIHSTPDKDTDKDDVQDDDAMDEHKKPIERVIRDTLTPDHPLDAIKVGKKVHQNVEMKCTGTRRSDGSIVDVKCTEDSKLPGGVTKEVSMVQLEDGIYLV